MRIREWFIERIELQQRVDFSLDFIQDQGRDTATRADEKIGCLAGELIASRCLLIPDRDAEVRMRVCPVNRTVPRAITAGTVSRRNITNCDGQFNYVSYVAAVASAGSLKVVFQ